MTPFEKHTLAELLALRQITIRLLANAGITAKHGGGDHDGYLKTLADAISRDIDLVAFPDLPDEDAETIRELGKERTYEIVTGASKR